MMSDDGLISLEPTMITDSYNDNLFYTCTKIYKKMCFNYQDYWKSIYIILAPQKVILCQMLHCMWLTLSDWVRPLTLCEVIECLWVYYGKNVVTEKKVECIFANESLRLNYKNGNELRLRSTFAEWSWSQSCV